VIPDKEEQDAFDQSVVIVVHSDGSEEMYYGVDDFSVKDGDLRLDDATGVSVACYPRGMFCRAYRLAKALQSCCGECQEDEDHPLCDSGVH
jgi:hypothetical protein